MQTPDQQPLVDRPAEADGSPAGAAPNAGSPGAVSRGRSRPLVAWMGRCVVGVGSRLPLWSMQLFGSALGQLVGRLPTRSRQRALVNLGLCLPELSVAERGRLARRSLASSIVMALELPALWTWDRDRIMALVKQVEGRQVLDAAVARGRGVILVMPHLGPFELAGLYCSVLYPSTGLFRPSRVREMDELLCRGRGRLGAKMVPAGVGAVRALRRALQAGDVSVILPDTDPKHGHSVFAPFFGVPANTGTLVSRLGRDGRCSVVFGVTERLGIGRGFRLRFSEVHPDVQSSDPLVGATALNREVEQAIRRLPEQYLWRYRRFRRRPPGEPELYDGAGREERA